ncbi:type II toxin-antitoxin system VapB family antitoxin [Aquabacter sp. CN5-332]|uniref:type II toxin-antitoxin system VapB family antitoxin n=1 Tax=Aquabacter sp. CN5-332 TaxID=3156608 RepID=UPI0032B50098
MARQLNIRSDEAVETAKRLAKRHGVTTTEVVVRALRRLDQDAPPVPTDEELTREQKAEIEALRRLSREAAKHAVPGATSDHSDMYDENGLPI